MIPKLSIFICCRILTLAYLPDMKVLRITLLLRTYLPHYNRATIALSYGTSCRLCYIDGNFCLLSYGVVNFQHFHYIESLDQISLAIHQALYTFTVTALSLFELTVFVLSYRVCANIYCISTVLDSSIMTSPVYSEKMSLHYVLFVSIRWFFRSHV